METLKGVLERIVFENAETGFVIARLASRDYPNELITVVGNLMSANPGESLLLKGWWVNNPQYGRQFKIEDYETTLPATVVGMQKYLGSGLIRGIGPVMAGRIVNLFGLTTIETIEGEPDELLQVPGIGPKRVARIKRAWEEQREIKDIMLFLQSHSVTTAYAVKIYKTYEQDSIRVVREEPYRLADDIYGIGFRTADKIAQNLGMEKDSIARLMSGVQYVLGQKADDGHVYLPRDKLVKAAREILEVEDAPILHAIDELAQVKAILAEDDAIYLAPFYYAEVGVANRLARLLDSPAPDVPTDAIKQSITRLEGQMGVQLADAQREAIRTAVTHKAMILTGGPGTGKTTTTLGMIRLFEQFGRRVILAAPTGRAAKRMSETTDREAKTIHRLLEFSPQEMGFKRNAENPLEADVVILDEVSMVDLVLMNQLIKAVPLEATLILVGDVDQLPSVGAGNVLRDLIDSEQIPLVRLTEIFRQAQQSMIVMNAHRINQGNRPELTGSADRDFFFLEEEDPDKAAELICDLVGRRLAKHYSLDPLDDIQVLCPMRRGRIGSEHLNQKLQETLNGEAEMLPRGGRQFRLGDKVMQIRNNYDYEVFNGDIGRIDRLDAVEQLVTVVFPDKTVTYDLADLNELVPAYAITIHKSQGSEYRAVVVPLLTQHYMMLQRNLLYTAITRAKELVVIVGTKKALAMAVRNNRVVQRYTRLSERLRQICESGMVDLPPEEALLPLF